MSGDPCCLYLLSPNCSPLELRVNATRPFPRKALCLGSFAPPPTNPGFAHFPSFPGLFPISKTRFLEYSTRGLV